MAVRDRLNRVWLAYGSLGGWCGMVRYGGVETR